MVGFGAPTQKYLACSHIRKQRSQRSPDDLCGAQDKKEQGHLCELTSCLVETIFQDGWNGNSAGATSASLSCPHRKQNDHFQREGNVSQRAFGPLEMNRSW